MNKKARTITYKVSIFKDGLDVITMDVTLYEMAIIFLVEPDFDKIVITRLSKQLNMFTMEEE